MRFPAGPTKIVVGGGILVAFLVALWILLPLNWFILCALILAFEVWTLVNKYRHDTISELVWVFNKRPVFPFAAGLGVASLLTYVIPPTLPGLWITFLIGGLCGHFWFSRVGKEG